MTIPRSDADVDDLIPLVRPQFDAFIDRVDALLDEHDNDPHPDRPDLPDRR